MYSKMVRWFKTPGVLLILLCMVIPALASTVPPGASPGAVGEGTFIRLTAATFDPLREVPALPDRLSYSERARATLSTRLLQFSGPVLPEWKQAVAAAGGQLGPYVPDYAFLVHLEADALEQVQALPFVRWVGPYEPAYKLAPGVDYADVRSYRILLAPWADASASRSAFSALSAEPRSYAGGLTAVLDGDQIDQVARMEDVLWIEPIHLQRAFNDVGGGTIMGGSTAWSSGYTGDGVTIAVADTGLDTGLAGTIHQDFSGRVTQIGSWPVQNVNWGGGCIPDNVGANDGAADLSSGHGTHVAGSVAGDGSQSAGLFKGLGYDASVTFQAVEQYTDWPSGCSASDGYYLTGIPDDVRTLLNEAYGWGARVHNNSWGGGFSGVYDQQAAYFDEFINGHDDMTVVVAAGNDGQDDDADGYVDEDSISSPGTAKNVITVGASDNERSSGGYQFVWGTGSWSDDYPADPTRNDEISDDRDELAAFSSRGPMADGRIKPDVVAPGTNILSVRSSKASGTGWGEYNQYYMYMGGTSMASPLVAGAAAVVREYYAEGESHADPSAALVKATLINSAVDMAGYGNGSEEAGQPIPNNHEGWGRVDVAGATTPGARQFVDDATGIDTGETQTYNYVLDAGQPFKVTLAWSDYPGAAYATTTLVNDLNLRVTAPNGSTTYWGNWFSGGWSQSGGSADDTNNVENVYVQAPTAGEWKVEVIGHNVPQGPQPYALVVDGAITQEELSVTGIQPIKAPNDAVLNDAVVSGAGFEETASADLLRGVNEIGGSAATVYTTTDTIVADFDLNGATVGWWDVRVSNTTTDTATLSDAFYVKDATLPDLELSLTASKSSVEADEQLTYTIAISNVGSVAASSVVFTDALPSDVSFFSLSPSCEGGRVDLADGFACMVPTGVLSGGEQIEYTLVVAVSSGAGGDLVNQVVVGSAEPEGYAPDNSDDATVQVQAGDVYLPLVVRNYPMPPQLPSTLDSVADACVLQGYPTTNLGNTNDMWAGYDDYLDPDGRIARSFVKFDLSEIPVGMPIAQATLHLYLTSSYDFPGRSRTITTYRLGSSWSESSVTWNSAPSIAEAYGSDSVTHGDWRWYSFNVTNLVQGWVNGTWPNYGLAVRGPEHSGSDSSWKAFYTRESSFDPYIEITYGTQVTTVPGGKDAEPGVKGVEPGVKGIELAPQADGTTIFDLLGKEELPAQE